ncbi:MAG: ribonuclease III, partial [Emcibacteraceae bacterium]|nr:ribonuclease III [Emcibacteraceae bacterium]
GPNYQRLEFIGDRVLGLTIAAWMYELYPLVGEGGLASRHTNLVRREACVSVGTQLELGRFLHMAKSSEDTGGRERETIIADACEAVIGAMYLDAGYAVAEKFIRTNWKDLANHVKVAERDAKTKLQELVQATGKPTPVYTTIDKVGPDHEPTFTIAVKVKGEGEENAKGQSKREAEQQAATLMLKRLEKSWKK